jgi:hypothetical protein
MNKDCIQNLENAIQHTNEQIKMLKLNRRANPNLLETLNKQKLQFQQELAKIRISEDNIKQQNKLFGLMDILDDEEVIKIPINSDVTNEKST